jgi:histone-lysine N-methyltransferase SETD1
MYLFHREETSEGSVTPIPAEHAFSDFEENESDSETLKSRTESSELFPSASSDANMDGAEHVTRREESRIEVSAVEALMALAGESLGHKAGVQEEMKLETDDTAETSQQSPPVSDDEALAVRRLKKQHESSHILENRMEIDDWTILNKVPNKTHGSVINGEVIGKQSVLDSMDTSVENEVEEEEGSPAPQIAMEHSYSLPPQKDPSSSPASLAGSDSSVKRKFPEYHTSQQSPEEAAFNHDHGYMMSQPKTPPKPLATIMEDNEAITPKSKKPRKSLKFEGGLMTPKKSISKVSQPTQSVVFGKRDIMAEMTVLYEFLTRGIDAEDISYLRRSYEAMLADDTQGYWLNDTHWVDHPDILSYANTTLSYVIACCVYSIFIYSYRCSV